MVMVSPTATSCSSGVLTVDRAVLTDNYSGILIGQVHLKGSRLRTWISGDLAGLCSNPILIKCPNAIPCRRLIKNSQAR